MFAFNTAGQDLKLLFFFYYFLSLCDRLVQENYMEKLTKNIACILNKKCVHKRCENVSKN